MNWIIHYECPVCGEHVRNPHAPCPQCGTALGLAQTGLGYAAREDAETVNFTVFDKMTGEEADPYEIALHEEWASGLCYCDMDGFAITQDGLLILCDECGRFEYCRGGRFKVQFEEEAENTIPDAPLVFWDIKGEGVGAFCPRCKYKVKYRETLRFSYCPRCGVRIGVNEDGKRFVYKWYGRKMPK